MGHFSIPLKASLTGASAIGPASALATSLPSNTALDEAFGYLSTYEWGHDRKRLDAIDQAINATAGNRGLRRDLERRLLAVLRSDAPRAAKNYVCRKLRLIGTNRSVRLLAALLPDENLSHMARYALERMPFGAAGEALRDALGKVSGRTKVGIINSLGMRGDREVVGALISLLNNSDIEVAGAAAFALGKAGTPQAARALSSFLTKAPEALRLVVTDAALNAAARLLRDGNRLGAVELYRRIEAHSKAPHVRTAARHGLRQAGKR
jgi:HEAT repeat protein